MEFEVWVRGCQTQGMSGNDRWETFGPGEGLTGFSSGRYGGEGTAEELG